MSSARDEILGRVRQAIGPHRAAADVAALHAGLSREYHAEARLSLAERLELLSERLRDYDALVHACTGSEIPAVIARIAAAREKRRLLVPPAFPAEWRTPEVELVPDTGFEYRDLDTCEGVLTDCALAIALTGTLVLRHSPERGRRALTLVPDYLLCVIRAEQVVETVPEGIRRMAAFGTDALTTISGPSATADIEMTRIKGVHGPRTLEVVLVTG